MTGALLPLCLLLVLADTAPPAPDAVPAPSTAPAPSAPVPRVMVMQVRVPAGATAPVQRAALAVERGLVDAMHRHSNLDVRDRESALALLDETARKQLLGCDAEGCLAELSEALGVELLLVTTLDARPGLWSLEASLVDRVQARAVRRAGVQSRSAEALLESLETIARQLSGTARLSLEQRGAAERLGTNEAGLRELRARMEASPDADMVGTWTDVIIAHNRESTRWAWLEVAALAGTVGGFLVHATVAMFAVSTYGTYRLLHNEAPAPLAVAFHLSAGLALVSVVVGLSIVGVVFAVDWMNRGRVRVSRHGCCRDEARVRRAQAPGAAGWAPGAVAAVAAATAVLTPVFAFGALSFATFLGVTGVMEGVRMPAVTGPLASMPEAVGFLVFRGPLLLLLVTGPALAAVGLALAIVMFLDAPSDIASE